MKRIVRIIGFVTLLFLTPAIASASNGFLGENSRPEKNLGQAGIHRASAALNAELHRVCDDFYRRHAADYFVWAHNTACLPELLFPAGTQPFKRYLPTEQIAGTNQFRATGIEARLNKQEITGGTPATYYPPGINSIAPVGNNFLARGHLLGKRIGGDGSVPGNIDPLWQQTANIQMRGYESTGNGGLNILRQVDAGFIVDYIVTPHYGSPQDSVPDSVRLQAKSSSGWSLDVTISNTP
jgi:hypothetical protein